MKSKSNFVCSNCGATFAKWAGRCENCNEWNTLTEQVVNTVEETMAKTAIAKGQVSGKSLKPDKIGNIIPSDAKARLKTEFKDLNTVLGGGILQGSVSLLAGQPGIGKSTLLMQICAYVSKDVPVLYISGEESAGQEIGRASCRERV